LERRLVVEDVNFLRSVALFGEFDPAELAEVRKFFHTTRFGAGDVILEEGKANRALHVVNSGRVRVSRLSEDGEIALCDLSAGQTFGELSVIEDGFASATIAAVGPCEVASISINDLAAFLRDKPSAAAKFWRQIAIDLRRRLIQTNDVVRTYFSMNRSIISNPKFREAYALCSR
jgi:CRP-like cAMP-binding protein